MSEQQDAVAVCLGQPLIDLHRRKPPCRGSDRSAARASRTMPPAATSANRAASMLAPDSRRTSASRRSPSQRANSARHSPASAPEACIRIVICRRASFAFVPAAHTIRLEYVRPSRTIDAVERAFSTIFCALDALSRVEPAIASGPVFTSRRWSASGPARRQAHRDIVGAQAGSRGRAERLVVLGSLDGHRDRLRAAGVVSNEDSRPSPECRYHLSCVQHADPARRSRSEVMNASACLKPSNRRVDDDSQVGQHAGYCWRHERVFGVQHPQQLQRRHGIDPVRPRIARFRDGTRGIRGSAGWQRKRFPVQQDSSRALRSEG